MDWAAKPIQQSPRTYSSAPAIAMRYRELETRCHERAGRGFDVEGAVTASYDAGGGSFDWTPLDRQEEFGLIRAIFAMAKADLKLQKPQIAERQWHCWWLFRIEGARKSTRPAGYDPGHVTEVVAAVDEYVEGAMDWHDVWEPREDYARGARSCHNYNALTEEDS